MTARTRPPMTRGPLPARVYWRRRLAVLGVVLLLVLGVARLLGTGSDGSSDGDTASLADALASTTAPTGPTAGASPRDAGSAGATPTGASAPATTAPPTPTEPVLAAPDGLCDDSDIAVTPEVRTAVAGPRNGVAIDLQLRTISDEACTWKVSAKTLTLKITSGKDDIWTSRECPRVLPRQQVTVRSAVTTTLSVAWNARRSDEDCSKLTEWALPGWYHVSAAALAGEPSQVQFELLAPQPVVVTQTAEPKQESGKKGKKGRKNKQSGTTPTDEPASTGEPSGAVEPDLG
ncbi:hypothetical protein [Nocardioides sp. W7]|uniref:hypothetical protein n=1 Tax=Nocardioides sp. W7 TaxID=2931390 RepID=UPI001FD0F026|nr:hypothetical protein [Nocardioides sp. W7]